MIARRACALALAAALAHGLVGCGDDDRTRSLVIELAQRPSGGVTCTNESVGQPALPASGCLAIRVWEGVGVDRRQVPLYRTDDDHGGDGHPELRMQIPESRRVTFDGRFGSGPYEVEVELYDGSTGAPIAQGANREAALGSSAVRVRLYAFDSWSCAGQRRDAAPTAQLLPRAMHAATSLNNGDVLIYGGVTGAGIATAPRMAMLPIEGGAIAQTAIEVYVASEERFVMAGGSFNRVLFGSTLLPRCPSGIDPRAYCVRVVGGFEAPVGQALRFSASQVFSESALGSPILPGQDAQVPASNSVLLVYDPRSRSVTEVADNLEGVSRTAFVAVTDFGEGGELSAAVVGSVRDTGGATFAPSFESAAALVQADGAIVLPSVSLGQNRLAAGVARLSPARDDFLVWGGNISATGGPDPSTDAGHIVDAAGRSVAVASGAGGVPPPVAFHTVTSIGTEGVLVAGGLKVARPAGAMDTPILRLAPDPGRTLVYLRADAAGTAITAFAPSDAGYTSTILHTATRLPGGDVLLVGGSERRTPSGGSLDLEFFEVAQVVRVSQGSPGTVTWRALPSLIEGRFGHATALLPDGRLLVTGGFRRNTDKLDALSSAEIFSFATPPAVIDACVDPDAPIAGDSGPAPVDAGAPRSDAGVGPLDASFAGRDAG